MRDQWQTPWGIGRDELLAKWEHVVEWSDHIFTWTSPRELAFLAEAASRATNILEVGSYHGRSALVMALANPAAKLTCIDNCENGEVARVFGANLKTQIEAGKCQFVEGTSAWLVPNPQQEFYDFAFIDAGHLFEDVRSDINFSFPCMAPGALLCGHDWNKDMNDGVNRAVLERLGAPRIYESIWWVELPK